jgi:hypothetical protein
VDESSALPVSPADREDIKTRHDALRRAATDFLSQLELVRERVPPEVMESLRHDIDRLRRETS